MSVSVPALGQFVQVLDQQAQASQAQAGQAQRNLAQTQQQLQRLQDMAASAGVKKLHASAALYANAAGFRSGLLDMAEQCKDILGVQQLEYAQAQMQMQEAFRRHGSMEQVLERARADLLLQQQRQEQKRMDELAGQAWQRQRRQADAGNR